MADVGAGITEYLKNYHTTEGEAIKSRELREVFNLTDRDLRNVVSALRRESIPICSSSSGYWYSKDPEDLEKTLHRMEAQVHNMNYPIAGLKKALQEVQDARDI